MDRSYNSHNSSSIARREQFFNNSSAVAGPAVAAKPPMVNFVSNGAVNLGGEKTINGLPPLNGDFDGHRSISPIVSAPLHSTNVPASGAKSQYHQLNQSAGSAVTVKEMHGYVGFANIPDQVYRKAMKRGFEFTLMVAGQSGLGKSTFINTLFLTDISIPGKNARLSTTTKTTRIEETTVRLVEKGVALTLTLVDTPGFGDAVDNSNCWDPVIQYVNSKFMDFFNDETKVSRKDRISDRRVHCCLYFIAPSGHGLKPLDIEFMKRLHDRVNVVPIIAKADTLTTEELTAFKQRINKEIDEHHIKIYDFPDFDENVIDAKDTKQIKKRVPFAVVGSNYVSEVGGKPVRCRRYPWGIVEVENLEHNDFVALRNMIIRKHMIDLIEITRNVHYENFRCNQLSISDDIDSESFKHPFTTMDEQRKEHEAVLKAKSEDMERILNEKVNGKRANLNRFKDELDLKKKNYEAILEEEKKRIAALKESLEQDRQVFGQQYPEFHKYTSSESLKNHKKKKGVF